MPSSQSKGIPLHHEPQEAGYRLLELPPELLALLQSQGPPPLLHLDNGTSSAILHTPGQAYALRLKSTSNSLLLLSSRSSPSTTDSSSDSGLATIATIHEMIELNPVPESSAGHGPSATSSQAAGKWHQLFGKSRG